MNHLSRCRLAVTAILIAVAWFETTPTVTLTACADEPSDVPGAPRLLPADTLAYLRIDSAEQLREGLADSSVGRMLADPAMRPFAGDFFQVMTELFQRVGDELGLTLEQVLAIPSGQVAIAAMPGNLSDEEVEETHADADDDSEDAVRRRIARKRRQQNSFASLLVIEAGNNIDQLRQIVDRVETRLVESGYVRRTSTTANTELVRLLPPRPGRPEVEYFVRDRTLVFGVGHQTASKALDQWLGESDEETLARNRDFTSVMSRCIGAEDTRPQITFFVDPYHIAERIVKRGGAAGFVWPIIEELGLSKIRGVGGSSFRGGEMFEDISHLHVLIDTPRDGFFGLLRPETGDTVPPQWVPADVTSYTSLHWDFANTYENFDKVLAKFQGDEPLQRFVEEPMAQQFDISVRDDVVELLTGRYVSCRWIQPPVRINSQVQLHAFEVKDPIKAKAMIAKIRDASQNSIDVATVAGNVVYFPKSGRNRKLPETLRQPEPCFMILGDWIIGCDSRKFLERVALAGSGALPRLANVSEYELVSSELGGKLDGEKPFMVSFLRGSEYVRQIYELAQSPTSEKFLRTRAENNPLAAKVVDMLQRNELPPFEKFEKYFAPSGAFGYDEAGGMHIGSFTLKAEE